MGEKLFVLEGSPTCFIFNTLYSVSVEDCYIRNDSDKCIGSQYNVCGKISENIMIT